MQINQYLSDVVTTGAIYCERQCNVSFKGEKSKCYCQKKKEEEKKLVNRNWKILMYKKIEYKTNGQQLSHTHLALKMTTW